MARVALPALGERLVMNVALLTYFAILSRGYGGAAIAAYAIGVRLLAFSWIPGLGFGVAAATLVGQALGAREVPLARQSGWRSVRLALIVMALLGVLVAFLRGTLARGFTADTAILEDLVPFLLTLAIAQPFMGVHFTLSGALRGAGDTMTPFLGAALGNWLIRVPLAYLLATRGASVVWVWSALVGDHIARSIWSVFAFRSGRWGRSAEVAPTTANGELAR
ncbi:MAG: MATE family efflux transporter [Polyangiaceae bacterium]